MSTHSNETLLSGFLHKLCPERVAHFMSEYVSTTTFVLILERQRADMSNNVTGASYNQQTVRHRIVV